MAHRTRKHCNISTTMQDLSKENKSIHNKHQIQKKVSSVSLPQIPVRCQQKNRNLHITSLPESEYTTSNGQRSCKRNDTENTSFLPLISADKSPGISVLKSKTSKENINSRNKNKKVERNSSKKQRESAEASTLPTRTPEPEVLMEFDVFVDGFAVVDEVHRKKSSYVPRYCWCTRCKMMFRMYKEGDKRLETWVGQDTFKG